MKKESVNSCHCQGHRPVSAGNPGLNGDERFIYQNGFSLIELLVVVLIIGILSAVALPQYQAVVLKNRFVQQQLLAESIYRAGQIYYMANGEYPMNFEEFDISFDCELSADKSFCRNRKSGFSCHLTSNNKRPDTAAVYCTLDNIEGSVDYLHFFMGGALCRASGAASNKLCQSMGGKNPQKNNNVTSWTLP